MIIRRILFGAQRWAIARNFRLEPRSTIVKYRTFLGGGQTSLLVPEFDNSGYLLQKRFKKKKPPGKQQRPVKNEDEEEDDEEEQDDSDQEDEVGQEDTKVVQTTVISFRLDAIAKTCFNLPRAKIEDAFYNNLIRVNGERVGKKSHEIHEGDQLDMIRGFNHEDHEKLDVNRVEIIKRDDKAASSGRYRITYRKTNRLTIENYQRDPYDGSLISSS